MKITIKNFQKQIPINPKRIKAAILKVLSLEGKNRQGEITVYFVNDRKIKELNLKYLDRNAPTDVLAFDLSLAKKPDQALADIIISTQTACRNAEIFKTTPLFEARLYAIHAVLHLLGYGDRTPRQRQLIRKKEKIYANTQD